MPVVRHFLRDIEDGAYDNFPSTGAVVQSMENPSLKERFGVDPDQTGVLVVRVVPGSPAEGVLQVGDTIIELDGHAVADDGTIEFRPRQRTQAAYLVQLRQVGESIPVTILRDGTRMALSLRLHRSLREDWLIPMEEYDVLPSYYIYGGVVFCPLSKNLLREWGSNWYNSAPKELVALLADNYRDENRDQLVMVLKVLAADVNQGYHEVTNWLVKEVNGQPVRNLRHLVELVELVEQDGARPYVEFKNPNGQMLVLDRERVALQRNDILATYRIDADRSEDLAPTPDPDAEGAGS
jgi:hypothetical protein